MTARLLFAALLPLSISLPLQALEVPSDVPTVAASSFPAAPPPVGLPQLQQQVSCPALQQRIRSVVGSEAAVWSVSVADANGRLLADVNGTKARIPASNQKLISTAIALDRLGPDYRLTTRLWRQPDGTLQITGEGDPDLDLAQLQRFAKLALGSGGSSGQASGPVAIQLVEEPQQRWWPQGWHWADRAEAYGAPITRLALTSNALDMAVSNPPSRMQKLLGQEIKRQGGSAAIRLGPVPTANTDAATLFGDEYLDYLDPLDEDSKLEDLKKAWLSSEYTNRTPARVEVPFETTIGGILVRGRIDAVYATADGFEVVDWKTGSTKLDASAAVQLAMYRLAWAKLSGTDISKISAAFHYVPTSVTDRPADLLDEAALIALIMNASKVSA